MVNLCLTDYKETEMSYKSVLPQNYKKGRFQAHTQVSCPTGYIKSSGNI